MDISKSGNGDVNIRSDTDFNVEMNGNNDIVNYGKGKAFKNKQRGDRKSGLQKIKRLQGEQEKLHVTDKALSGLQDQQ